MSVAPKRLRSCLLSCMRIGGAVLCKYFGRVVHPRQKEVPSSIVCDADLASEARILKRIQADFPDHNIIAEETGRVWRASQYTWVIDPLDGTSNFVAGIPWFGVQVALLRGGQPLMAAMYLPADDTLYFAERARGSYRNGKRIRAAAESDLEKVLCAFGFDPEPRRRSRPLVEMFFRISGAVRNTRATNSLVDFCYTVDGRFGASINLKTKIWDIAPTALLLSEAGGEFTGLDGQPIIFDLGESAAQRNYAVLGAGAALHSKMAALARRGLRVTE